MQGDNISFKEIIESYLTSWVKSNVFLSSGTSNPEMLFKWREGDLHINLNVFKDDIAESS